MAVYTTDTVRGREAGGFTLLELMLALSIMAMVMVAVYASFSAGSKACRYGSQRAQIFHGARLAMQDIIQSVENVEFGLTNTLAFKGRMGSASAKGQSVGDDELEFATLATPMLIDGMWRAGVSRVRYRINREAETAEGKQSTIRLEKQIARLSDMDFENAYTIELAPNVVGLGLRFLDEDNFDSEWDSEDKHKLPETVEITLYVAEEGSELIHQVRSSAMIPSMKVRDGGQFKPRAPEVDNPALQRDGKGRSTGGYSQPAGASGGSGRGSRGTSKPPAKPGRTPVTQ